MSVAVDMVDELRLATIAATPEGMSRALLDAFADLVQHDGPDPEHAGVYYQDRELRGAICATALEAQLLHMAVHAGQPRNALEIGSYVGWTAAHMAAGLTTGGHLVCIDDLSEGGDKERQLRRFKGNLTRAGLDGRVRLEIGRSPDVLSSQLFVGPVDFAFVDGFHLYGQPLADVRAVAGLMAADGVIALHDTYMNDVSAAMDWLIMAGWTATIFPTPGRLAMLYKEQPTWWAGFVEDTSA